MRIVVFFSKIQKDVAKFVVCCGRDWRFKCKKKNIRKLSALISKAFVSSQIVPCGVPTRAVH